MAMSCGGLSFQPIGVGTNKWGTDPQKPLGFWVLRLSLPGGPFEVRYQKDAQLLFVAQLCHVCFGVGGADPCKSNWSVLFWRGAPSRSSTKNALCSGGGCFLKSSTTKERNSVFCPNAKHQYVGALLRPINPFFVWALKGSQKECNLLGVCTPGFSPSPPLGAFL